MSRLSSSYIALQEGKISKSEFLRQARQSCPQAITQYNSFEDAIQILRNRGLLSEAVMYANEADRFPLESIDRGIRYELEKMGACTVRPTKVEYAKAKELAVANLGKDPLYYLNLVAGVDKKKDKVLAESITSDNNERQDFDTNFRGQRSQWDDILDKAIKEPSRNNLDLDYRGIPKPPLTQRYKNTEEEPKQQSSSQGGQNLRRGEDFSNTLSKGFIQQQDQKNKEATERWYRNQLARQKEQGINLHRFFLGELINHYGGPEEAAKFIKAAVNNPIPGRTLEEDEPLDRTMLRLYRNYRDGNYLKKTKDGDVIDGPPLDAQTALGKAVLVTRKHYGNPTYIPSRKTLLQVHNVSGQNWLCLSVGDGKNTPRFELVTDKAIFELRRAIDPNERVSSTSYSRDFTNDYGVQVQATDSARLDDPVDRLVKLIANIEVTNVQKKAEDNDDYDYTGELTRRRLAHLDIKNNAWKKKSLREGSPILEYNGTKSFAPVYDQNEATQWFLLSYNTALSEGQRPDEAARNACIAVREHYYGAKFVPDKKTLKQCTDPGWVLRYVGELKGPVFEYMSAEEMAARLTVKEAQRGRPRIDRPQQNSTEMNRLFFDLYIKYVNGTYQVKDPETGELKPGKAVSQVIAARKACMMVRKHYKNNTFRPDRNTLASCGVGRQSLKYAGEQNGRPDFLFSYGTDAAYKGDMNEYRTPGAKNKPKDPSAKPAKKSSEGAKKGPKAIGTKDSVYDQFYKHYKSKGLSDHEAKIKANSSWKKYKEKHATNENKKDERALLKEAIMKLIPSVLQEAATVNLAKFSDENASVAELPVIINSLETAITEIDSFNIKMQAKIQGIFDSIGNLKNEDGISIGYKFAKPILDSFAEDLVPVIEKTNFTNGIKLPEAPAPDQTQVVDPNNPDLAAAQGEAPEEKQTVFSPAAPTAPDPAEIAGAAAKAAINLRESKKPKGRYIR